MRNKDNCIASPKQPHGNENDLITFIIFEKPSNIRLKSIHFPFIRVHGKSLLEKQIDVIRSVFKNFEIIFVCGKSYLKIFDHLKQHQNSELRLIENQNFDTSNCCESIRIGLTNTFNNKVIIMPEDIIFSNSFFKYMDNQHSSIFVHQNNFDNNFDIGAIYNDDKLENLTIGIKENYWSEILFLHNEKVLSQFKEILFSQNFKNKMFFESINYLNYIYSIKVINIPQCIKINNVKILKRININENTN